MSQERIVGLTYVVDAPGISNIVEKRKAIKNRAYGNNLEGIIVLKSDVVVVVDFFLKEMIQTLRDFGIKVYVYKTQVGVDTIKESIRGIVHWAGET